jgi:type I restriction enzyme R subunit
MSFTEETLEKAVIALFSEEQIIHHDGRYIHKEMSDVLLRDDLKQFLLNQYADDDITLNEVFSIMRKLDLYPSSALYESNKAILKLISDGFTFQREDRTQKDLFIRLLDFDGIIDGIDYNIYKIVNQLEIQGYEKRIPDAIVYINGLPMVVIEFKSAVKLNATIKDAYTQLTVRYRRDIPELFKYNAFCVISDGSNSKSGSLFSKYDDFYAWRKVAFNDEPVDGIDSLFTMIHGLFNKQRLKDVIHNFIHFPDASKDDLKIVCRYPQYYAANKLFDNIKANMRPWGNGKGGTYFGATGCGKSFTMLFLTRLLMRSVHFSSPTIILITDRNDLDDQLSAQFTNAKSFIGDQNVISVESREELKQLLQNRNSGGVFLTTIHKFTESTELLTDRCNVICISDEAHRSQINLEQKVTVSETTGVTRRYGFAKYLHDSLPNATYVGFSGTPIDGTLEVFGPVIDAYTMQDSVADKITVRIVYEGRAARVLLNEKKLIEIEEYYNNCAAEGTNEYQIEESKRETTRMEAILGDPKRLKLLATDFIAHYEKRVSEGASVLGKVMLVSSSRPIAYNLYKEIIFQRPQWAEIRECDEGVVLIEYERQEIKPIEKINMVMTRDKDDHKALYDQLGTKDDRKELDRQFKNAKSNFKIAIVVDMWITGFDVPFLDTMYIDKPLQQHSLIQTISRVNRVYEGKEVGLVVDYFGIKSNMDIALAMFSKTPLNNFEDISKAVTIVKDQLDLLSGFFHKFDNTLYFTGTPLQQLKCLNRAAEFVQLTEDMEKRFMAMVKRLRSAYNLCCANEKITEEEKDYIHFYFAIQAIIHKLSPGETPDTAKMNDRVRMMIEEALISEGIEEIFKLDKVDAQLNNDIFSDEYMSMIAKIKLPHTKIKLLQNLLAKAIEEFKKTNKIKGVDFSKKLKHLVDVYNTRDERTAFDDQVLDDLADRFADLFKAMQEERNSFRDMGIDFEEKAFYDILKAVAHKYNFEYPENKLIKLSRSIKVIVDDKARYTDWSHRDDIKAELKVDLILVLAENGYPPVPKDEIFKEIFEQAENFKKYNT